jgi:hypothetical protein
VSLRTEAEALNALGIEDTDLFGQAMTLTNPAGTSAALVGDYNDIGAVIDPETGTLVSGRSASMTLRISSIIAAGFTELPRRISNESSKPWRVQYTADDSVNYSFIVRESMPDRSAGVIVLILEEYDA